MKQVPPDEAMKAFHREFASLLAKHLDALPAQVVLATAAYAVGQILALQDQRTMTPALAMQVVMSNIEKGNADYLASFAALVPAGRA